MTALAFMAASYQLLPNDHPSRSHGLNRQYGSRQDDWSGWTDPKRRRKAQNLLNKRAQRERAKAEKQQQKLRQEQEEATKPRPENLVRELKPKALESRGDEVELRSTPNSTDVWIEVVSDSLAPPPPSPAYDLNTLEYLSPILSCRIARRIFHYAITLAWPALSHRVMPLREDFASAVFRSCLTDDATMRTTIWAVAQPLLIDRYDPGVARVQLREQTKSLASVRRSIERGVITDSDIYPMMAFTSTTDMSSLSGNDATGGPGFGLFDSPIKALGGLRWFRHYRYAEEHWALWPRLLERRGGLATVALPGVPEMTQMADLLYASQRLGSPFLSLCSGYQYLADEILPSLRTPVAEVGHWPISSEELKGVLLDLKLACQLVSQYCGDGNDGDLLFQVRQLAHYRLLRVPHGTTDEVCRLASLIFSFGVTFPLEIPGLLPRLANQLSGALRSPELTIDLSYEVLFWATMMGAMAVGCASHGGGATATDLFAGDLGLLAQKLEIRAWDEAKTVLQSFLWLDLACDQGGRIVWNQIIMGG
ncbi:hypothetical protein F4778DRAFT_73061 [Xylariomycetidae sp. FL2044]|nr:hypothetical protein F4778DRAFT_73061 [Xylariomycetidae sp. FL2044]